ncbi:MAG: YqaA family protein [Candidatus Hinthialibacter antarcticus]|nr:YqaA family protein [Candidatus Hinthialibacter antarcticus]
MFSELKDWTISLVIQNNQFTDNALVSLGVLSFAESSFFPIPPDIPFILMGVIQPDSAYLLATILTVTSVLGGALGYAIGRFGGRPFVTWLVNSPWTNWIFNQEKFDKVEGLYNKYDVWVVLAAAFTPIPYKVFTIAGGLCRIPFWRFMLASLVGRAGRFYLVGSILYFFGEQAKPLLHRFDLFLAAMLVLGIFGFISLRFIGPKKNAVPPVE